MSRAGRLRYLSEEDHPSSNERALSQRVGVIWYGELPRGRKDAVYIYDIHIDERFRGRGYGTATLRLVEDRARELGKRRIALHVSGHNGRARKLYEELGYRPRALKTKANKVPSMTVDKATHQVN